MPFNRRERRWSAGLGLVAAALLVLAATLWSTDQAFAFGWFAYAPIGSDTLSQLVVMSPRRYAAVASAAAGLLLLAGLAGFTLARRRDSHEPD
jgi:heme/copper-type cytochrome/quinol oxidase subunit 1